MKKLIKSLILLMIPLSMLGQLTPVSDQYILNPLTINPAYTGSRGALNLAAFYRRQWVGIKGAPETVTLAGDAAVWDGKLGLGLIISNDQIGVTKKTAFNTLYSYKISINEGDLSFGLGAGLITTNTTWSDLVIVDPEDADYLVDSKILVVPDFSFGIYYTYDRYFAGLSIPRLINHQFDNEKNKYTLKFLKHYYYLLNTGYAFDLGKKTRFLPSTLLSFSPGEKLLYDLNANFSFYDRLWSGVSYRSNRSVAGFFQFQVNNQLKIAYTYDFNLNKLRSYSNGSHEVMLRYEFRYKVDVVNPLIF